MQGRGLQGAKSPLLWEDHQVQEYLAGSPLIGEIKERLKVSAEEALFLSCADQPSIVSSVPYTTISWPGHEVNRYWLHRGLKGSTRNWTPCGI